MLTKESYFGLFLFMIWAPGLQTYLHVLYSTSLYLSQLSLHGNCFSLGWVFAAGLVWILVQRLVSSAMHIGELRIQDFLWIWPGLTDIYFANELKAVISGTPSCRFTEGPCFLAQLTPHFGTASCLDHCVIKKQFLPNPVLWFCLPCSTFE